MFRIWVVDRKPGKQLPDMRRPYLVSPKPSSLWVTYIFYIGSSKRIYKKRGVGLVGKPKAPRNPALQ